MYETEGPSCTSRCRSRLPQSDCLTCCTGFLLDPIPRLPEILVELPPPRSPVGAALGWRCECSGFPVPIRWGCPLSYRSRCRLVGYHSRRLGCPIRHSLRVASTRDCHRSRRPPELPAGLRSPSVRSPVAWLSVGWSVSVAPPLVLGVGDF